MHFLTIVFTGKNNCKEANEKVVEMLEPYGEDIECTPKKYFKFVKDEDEDYDEEMGEHGYWKNPNAKWDYWRSGGRYTYFFKTEIPDSCIKIKDMDMSASAEQTYYAKRLWEIIVENDELKGDEERPWHSFQPELYLPYFKTKENFVNFYTAPGCSVYVDEEGWHENNSRYDTGENGIKAYIDFLKQYRHRLETADPESYIGLIDCHM